LSTVFLDAALEEEDGEARDDRAMAKWGLEMEASGPNSSTGDLDCSAGHSLSHKSFGLGFEGEAEANPFVFPAYFQFCQVSHRLSRCDTLLEEGQDVQARRDRAMVNSELDKADGCTSMDGSLGCSFDRSKPGSSIGAAFQDTVQANTVTFEHGVQRCEVGRRLCRVFLDVAVEDDEDDKLWGERAFDYYAFGDENVDEECETSFPCLWQETAEQYLQSFEASA